MRPFGHCSGDHDGTRRRCPLWHNFSASALPHSPSSLRRLYRFYAMEVFRSPRGGGEENAAGGGEYVCLSISGDAFMSQQVRGMVALAVAGARGLVSAEDIAACIDPTRQEDLLPVPLAPALPCSLAEVGYTGWQTRLGVDGGGVCMSPGAEQRACLPLEGWSDNISRSAGADFRRGVLESAARWWEDQQGGAGWLRDVLVPGALKLRRELDASNRRAGAAGDKGGNDAAVGEGSHDEGNRCSSRGEPSSNSSNVDRTMLSVEELTALQKAPAAYAKVLRLLRKADASGCWPYSTVSRSLVIVGDKEERGDIEGGFEAGRNRRTMTGEESNDADGAVATATAAIAAVNVSAVDSEEKLVAKDDGQQQPTAVQQQQQRGGGGSGSFTLGAFPPPCLPPRGNHLFPALARAAFELEAALLPNRPASTTIAVNRNARFKPHVDSGAGAGQSKSLIVGLGDYKCGELVVEGEEVDIRYRPLEFNGWTQRHWTRPFFGERYSLVWFTPKGCEGVTGDARFSTTPTPAAAAVGGTGGER